MARGLTTQEPYLAGARTLRLKLAKLYPEFLKEFPDVPDCSSAKWSADLKKKLPRRGADRGGPGREGREGRARLGI